METQNVTPMSPEGLHAALQEAVRFPDVAPLSTRQLALLVALHLDPERSTGHYARLLAVAKPVATRAVDKLVEARLATRYEDPRDRRLVRVRLTAPGSDMVRRMADAGSRLV